MLSSSCVSYHVEHHRNRKYLLTYLLHRIEQASSQAGRRVHDDGDSNLLVVRTIRPFSDQSKTMFLSSPLDLQLATYLASALLCSGGLPAAAAPTLPLTWWRCTVHSACSEASMYWSLGSQSFRRNSLRPIIVPKAQFITRQLQANLESLLLQTTTILGTYTKT